MPLLLATLALASALDQEPKVPDPFERSNKRLFAWTPSLKQDGTLSSVEGNRVKFSTPSGFHEAIVSWNAEVPAGAIVRAQLKVFHPPPNNGSVLTAWYQLGVWNGTTGLGRTSIPDQKDDYGTVATDTYVANGEPVLASQVVIDLQPNAAGQLPKLHLVTLQSTRKAGQTTQPDTPYRRGKVLEPPRRFQLDYPNGQEICSPTATSMVLGYWAEKLGRADLDKPVPEVCAEVKDAAYGYGNWTFNTAYAGSQPGMRAYVSRFDTIGELEQWIDRDVPVVCSVSRTILQGKQKEPKDGHLVVLAGFTPEGDPVFNDPGRKVMRITYKREDFAKAWSTSGRTVYLIYPKSWCVPEDKLGHWFSG